ncbi:unnamed protein product [Protopolystoma xenopodis]|uniref:Uncharacterized protein n=1 Tax=Protopolystoma xenopodis TaxID=117903 RepID=A0A3S5BKB3_9PLAT|nr:unnamed protein product [Protopolystoma xenopodis]
MYSTYALRASSPVAPPVASLRATLDRDMTAHRPQRRFKASPSNLQKGRSALCAPASTHSTTAACMWRARTRANWKTIPVSRSSFPFPPRFCPFANPPAQLTPAANRSLQFFCSFTHPFCRLPTHLRG